MRRLYCPPPFGGTGAATAVSVGDGSGLVEPAWRGAAGLGLGRLRSRLSGSDPGGLIFLEAKLMKP
jgi:hypothetical protein